MENGGSSGRELSSPSGVISLKTFNEMCQQKHVVPQYHTEPCPNRGGWRGSLEVCGVTFIEEGPLPTIKAVKEKLAPKGARFLATSAERNGSETGDPVSVNWVGKLQEDIVKLAPGKEPDYQFSDGATPPFTCTVTLPLSYLPGSGVFTSSGVANKKLAKAAAARAACEALARAALVSNKQSIVLPGIPTPPARRSPEPRYHTQLLAILHDNGCPPPRYELERDESSGQTLFSGSVYFPNTTLAGRDNFESGGPLGKVVGIYGRDNAKEELAKQVLPLVQKHVEERLKFMRRNLTR